MKHISRSLAFAAAAGAAMLASATPEVSAVTMVQGSGSRLVTITYELTEDAVVTLDVLTNATPNAATGWASIGGKAVCNAQGAVWRKVTSADADGQGKYTITWRPDNSWTDDFGKGFKIADGCAKAVVTAYALDNTPDYMVVDITSAAQPNTQRYYPSVDFLPGGLLDNPDYRTTSVVMRKIMAKDVTWTMGSTALETTVRDGNEDTHKVTLTNNYYIGVFEVTQEQWGLVQTGRSAPSAFNNPSDRAMRPVEKVSYNEIRMAANSTTAASGAKEWPDAPYEGSFLNLLRTKTGIDFDLPSEAQWEFAARAGNGDTKWGDGSGILNATTDDNLRRLGRYKRNGGYVDGTTEPDTNCRATNGTAICGSHEPNDWGLYDMHGNVWEWCLDWYADNIGSSCGRVNTAAGSWRVYRGGAWKYDAHASRPAKRDRNVPSKQDSALGFRLACTAGLE